MEKLTTSLALILFLFGGSYLFAQNTTEFSRCPNVETLPYYRYEELNEKSFPEIKDYFTKGFENSKMKNLSNNTGIVTVQFKINCKGEAGEFIAFSCDLNYVPNEVSPKIIDYFLDKAKSLGGWQIPTQTEGIAGNAHKFYSFRIVNGEIKEILPK